MHRTTAGILAAATIAFATCAAAHAQDISKIPEIKPGQIVFKPFIPYPDRAKRLGMVGTGIVIIEVNSSTGEVITTRMGRSTGYALLDQAATEAFRGARFAKGTPKLVKIPATFKLRP